MIIISDVNKLKENDKLLCYNTKSKRYHILTVKHITADLYRIENKYLRVYTRALSAYTLQHFEHFIKKGEYDILPKVY